MDYPALRMQATSADIHPSTPFSNGNLPRLSPFAMEPVGLIKGIGLGGLMV